MMDVNSFSDTEKTCLNPLRLRGVIFHARIAYLTPLPGYIVPAAQVLTGHGCGLLHQESSAVEPVRVAYTLVCLS